jgi:putative DNA primase/helicase
VKTKLLTVELTLNRKPRHEAVVDYGLEATKDGKPIYSADNIRRVLLYEPMLVQHVWYDTFLGRLMSTTDDGGYEEWFDEDDMTVVCFLNRIGLTKVTPAQVSAILMSVHLRRVPVRHAVRDYLDALRWDGVPRIDTAFERYWGAEVGETQPAEYLRAASKNFFIGLMARVYRPGCQLDNMVVFEGAQGIRKSSSLRVLGGDWYAQASDNVHSKDFLQSFQGKWIIEIGELDAFSRADVTKVKTVITTPTDRYRESYARRARDFKRQCVFVGTTNKDNWGNDDTGLRRFWPVRCGRVHLAGLTADRDQLFAEARARYRADETWWEMPGSPTKQVQESRQSWQTHPWTPAIAGWLLDRDITTITEILTDCLKHDLPQLNKHQQLIVAAILRGFGWSDVREYYQGKQRRVWRAPSGWREDSEPHQADVF